MKGKINPLQFGLLGFAQGFLADLKQGFETERARKAKELEMQRLRQLELEDRAHAEARDDAKFERQTQFQKELSDKEFEQRKDLSEQEIAARRELSSQELAVRQRMAAEGNAAQIEAAKIAAASRDRSDDPRLATYVLPDQTVVQLPVGQTPPAGARLLAATNIGNTLPSATKMGPIMAGPYNPDATKQAVTNLINMTGAPNR